MLTVRDYRYFEVARAVSKTSEFKRVKIGAVVVLDKSIIAVSSNIKKSHPLQKKYNEKRFGPSFEDNCHHFQHAEFAAIAKVMHRDLSRAKIYVFREDKYKKFAICRPCIACTELIRHVGIKDVYYTTPNGYVYEKFEERKIA